MTHAGELPRDRKRILPPWYFLIAIIAFILTIGSVLTVMGLERLGVRLTRSQMGVILVIMVGSSLFAVLWLCWVLPFFDARELRPRWSYAPVWRHRLLILLSMLPTVSILLVMAMLIWGERSYRDVMTSGMGSLLIAALLTAGIGLLVSHFSGKRFRRTIAEQYLCYRCGYDIRMTEGDTCPECGAVLAKP